MALTAMFVGLGLTAAEAAALSGGIAAAAGTGAAAAGTGAAAGAAGAGLGAGAALGAEAALPAVSAIPVGAAPAAAELPIGPMMGQGVDAFAQGPVSSAAQPAWYDKFFSGAKSMGQDMMPKSTTDYLRLGQTGSQMMTPRPPPPAPSPGLMRPQGTAIPLGDPARLRELTVQNGGPGGIDPRTMAILAKLIGGGGR